MMGSTVSLVHRTEVMSDIFTAIKSAGHLPIPRWEQFEEPFAEDFLSIFSRVQQATAPDSVQEEPGLHRRLVSLRFCCAFSPRC